MAQNNNNNQNNQNNQTSPKDSQKVSQFLTVEHLPEWAKIFANMSAITFVMLIAFTMYKDFAATVREREMVLREEFAAIRAANDKLATMTLDRIDRLIESNNALVKALREVKSSKGSN